MEVLIEHALPTSQFLERRLKMPLETVLADCLSFPRSDALFADRLQGLTLATACIVHDPDDVDGEEDDLPNVARKLGFSYVIDMQTLQSICLNMKEQKPAATVDDLYRAFLFYLANDAFIVL